MRELLFVSVLLVMTSCGQSNKENYIPSSTSDYNLESHPGKRLMEVNCNICHSSNVDHKNRLAPPMFAVKKHYIDDTTTKTEFIEAIQAWIKNPNEEDARMHGAINRFGVMPRTPFPEETIVQIADYMFEYDLDRPGNHKGDRLLNSGISRKTPLHSSENEQAEAMSYSQRGLEIALATKQILGKNLMEKIQKDGTIEAISFCHEMAHPITDSMSTNFNATIKRVSDKPRNPRNKANVIELGHIQTFKNDLKIRQEPEPIVEERENEIHVYYPIITNAMCLQCHGQPEETLNLETISKLKQLYPSDRAIGYDVNEVRGIWHVSLVK